jgi:hypothetical protein
MTASMAPLGAVGETAAAPVREDDSAGALLERGFMHFHQNRPEAAAVAFSGAIATGNLNDAGRALAYWHIAEARRRLDDEDLAAEALSSFAIAAQDVIDVRGERRFAVDTKGDFVDNFRLESRIAEARGYVQAIWARRAPYFGRSLDNPVLAETAEEAEFFLRFATACSQEKVLNVTRDLLATVNGVPLETIRVERVSASCGDGELLGPYFVVVPTP